MTALLDIEANTPAWIAARGAAGLAALRARGLPHRRIEDWKYSDLRDALLRPAAGTAAASAPVTADPFADVPGTKLSLHDGVLLTPLSGLPLGIEAADLRGAAPDWARTGLGSLTPGDMAAASLALMAGGLALRVGSGVAVGAPLQLDIQSLAAHHSRILIVLEDGASLTLIERHAHASQANLGVDIMLGEGASLHHIRFGGSAASAVVLQTMGVRQAKGSAYHAHYADLGAAFSRLELHLELAGPATRTALSGVQLLGPGLHSDVTTRLTHSIGDNASAQLFKQVIGTKARAVYQGRITVAKGADGTDSRQQARALLLDVSGEADLKPELIIFAEDVACAHGAAVGDLDPEHLFYLRARGIPDGEARALLLQGFLEEPLTEIGNETIRASLWGALEAALAALVRP